MQVRRTDGTVAEVSNREGRQLIREGNAQAVTETPAAATPDTEPGADDAAPKPPRKQS